MKNRCFWIFDDSFIIPTFLSVASFVEHCKEEVNLVFYGKNIEEVNLLFNKLAVPFNLEQINLDFFNMTIDTYNISFSNHIKNRELRFYVASKAKDDTAVFLFDSDVLFSSGVIEFFDICQKTVNNRGNYLFANKEFEHTIDNLLFFNRKRDFSAQDIISKNEQSYIYQKIYGSDFLNLLNFPQYNNGVLVFYNTENLVTNWKELYSKGLKCEFVNPEDDQVPLAVAVIESKAIVVELSNFFNSKGELNGNYAIFHAFVGRWREELINAILDIPYINETLSDVAKIYKSKIGYIENIEELKSKYLSVSEPYLFNSIEGFFFCKEQYNEIFYALPNNGIFIEIGTYKGKSICYFAELVKYKNKYLKIIGIDNYSNKGFSQVILFQDTLTNIQNRDLLNFIELLNEDSVKASSKFIDNSIDCVFIDGDHSFDGVYADLVHWYKKVKNGGLLAGDDYTRLESVKLAVDVFCLENKLHLKLKGQCFWIVKP